jgi:hypothetical protein
VDEKEEKGWRTQKERDEEADNITESQQRRGQSYLESRRANFQDQIRAGPDVLSFDDGGASIDVQLVAELSQVTRSFFHQDFLEALLLHELDIVRSESHTFLSHMHFFGTTNHQLGVRNTLGRFFLLLFFFFLSFRSRCRGRSRREETLKVTRNCGGKPSKIRREGRKRGREKHIRT